MEGCLQEVRLHPKLRKRKSLFKFETLPYGILKGFQVAGQAPKGEPDERILIRDRGRIPTGNAPGT